MFKEMYGHPGRMMASCHMIRLAAVPYWVSTDAGADEDEASCHAGTQMTSSLGGLCLHMGRSLWMHGLVGVLTAAVQCLDVPSRLPEQRRHNPPSRIPYFELHIS